MDENFSDENPCCILCGLQLYVRDWFDLDNPGLTCPTLWMSEFRAEGDDWMNPKLSGVGLRATRRNLAPIDPNSRYDDPNINQETVIQITLFKTIFGNDSVAPYFTTAKSFPGFGFHEACWTLLKSMYQPTDIDIRLLNNIYRSFPIQGGLINWGHDYGGRMHYSRDFNSLIPGEVPMLNRLYIHELLSEEEDLNQVFYFYSPSEIPGLTQILHESFASTSSICREQREAFEIPLHIQDPFTRLPVEILEMILMELPSKDVLHLKLASCVFSNILLPQSFFASRFNLGFEFRQILEAQKYHDKIHNWKILYVKVKELSKTHNFRNRMQIWWLILQLQDLLTESCQTPLEGPLSQSFFEPDVPDGGLICSFVSGDLRGPEQLFDDGCRALWTRHTNLPREISSLFVSFTDMDNSYICGLRFEQDNGDDICLGYIRRQSELPLATGHLTFAGDGQNVHGIKLALDKKAFRAISLLMDKERNSNWLGTPDGVPKIRLASLGSPLTALKAGFDVG
ncbi:hypothetical protein PHISCL_01062 [Aspergillus sclerotialis]|uniref:F-box domain-containing protein n=1 Tax=Aspergillus sclerotialis TaxID=2070753 RepID=A0A3A2ZU05_9EURO|nr:hypothetical protein PHISCL_01062 [Aspergillus sclerotialis]